MDVMSVEPNDSNYHNIIHKLREMVGSKKKKKSRKRKRSKSVTIQARTAVTAQWADYAKQQHSPLISSSGNSLRISEATNIVEKDKQNNFQDSNSDDEDDDYTLAL
jgi:hypothetical protein